MDERLKNLLFMGIGLASTSQKAKILLDKLELEGKLSEEEGRRIVAELIDGVKQEGSHLQENVYEYMAEVLNELNSPSKREFMELQNRVKELEDKLKEKGHDV